MTKYLLCLHLLCIALPGLLADPDPGRIPKVYNALITSNQNLEPSKAYPVYQPVLHDASFVFPYHSFYYGANFPFGNTLIPGSQPLQPRDQEAPQTAPSSEAPITEAAATSKKPEEQDKKTPAVTPPLPPATESPIPLNEFGLPPQVIPLSRIDPAYGGFNQVGPFHYSYPGFRLYDPYDSFGYNLYPNTPIIYGPLTNVLGQYGPVPSVKDIPPTASALTAESSSQKDAESPPPEPNNLTILNYSSVDPNIPNVPPPPFPEGGLKPDKKE